MKVFNLPDLGEGLPDAEIVEWFVQTGDEIKQGDRLVAMETAKAIVDIPSPQSGRVARLYGKVGDVIDTGSPLLGFGEDEVVDSGTVVGEIESTNEVISEQALGSGHIAAGVKATPAVRALAHRMEVELSMVTPSGHDGVILSDDVRRVARILAEHGKMESLRGVRRAMARNMAQAHAEVSPATVVDDADITHLQSRADITPALIHALVAGCRAEPSLNAWYDSHANGRRILDRIHLGLAVDAPQGLFVAVMPDIQADDQESIAGRLVALKQKIKNRSLKPSELRGYSITLSNFGAIGGRYASPVVLPPTVAILGAGEARDEAVVRDGRLVIRHMLPLSLSFDHRVVTGGEATRFLKAVIGDLQG